MTSGHPDWQTYAGKAIGGSRINVAAFEGDIGSGITGSFDLLVIPEGEQHSYVKIHVGCDYNDAIQDIILTRISDGWDFFVGKFIGSQDFDVVVDPEIAGEQVRLSISNNSAANRTFTGSISWVIREL